MKTKLKFLARSVILLMMLLAGSVTQGAWGATLLNGAKIYFDASESNWGKDGATFKVNWYIGEAWQSATVMERIDGTNIWSAQSPKDGINKVEFLRMDENGQTQWNYTEKAVADPDNNCYYATSFTDGANTVRSRFYGTKTYTIWYQVLKSGEWKSAVLSDNTATIHLSVGESYFNLNNGITAWGNTGKMTRNSCTNWQMNSEVFNGGASCTIDADVDGNYVFTLSPANKEISITYPSNVTPEPEEDDVWRIVGLGDDDSWEKPLTKGKVMTHAYGNVYYYHYEGSTTSYFRAACGTQQYHTNNSSVTIGGSRINLVARPKGEGDQKSIQVPGACYICIDTETNEVWFQSSVPDVTWRLVGLGEDNWENPLTGKLMSHSYGNVFYYHYDGSAISYFRAACGTQQYNIADNATPKIDGAKVDMNARISGQNDNRSIAVPGACYICIDTETKQIWYQSTAPVLAQGTDVYFDASVNGWKNDNATFKIEWYNADGKIGGMVNMTREDETDIYKAQAPAGDVSAIKVFRYSSDGNDYWNETSITPVDQRYQYYYATGWSSGEGASRVTYPLGLKNDGYDITLNIYWYVSQNGTGNFNSWIYNENESLTKYTNGSKAGWYTAQETTTEEKNGRTWYKVTLHFTGVNSTDVPARLGVGTSYVSSDYLAMEDLIFSNYKVAGTYDVYYFDGKMVADADINEYYLIVKNADKTLTQSYKMNDSRFRVIGITAQYESEKGKLSKRYFTSTVKAEWLFDGQNYCYIASDAAGNNAFARPSDGNKTLSFSGDDLYGVSGYKRETVSTTTSTGDKYFVINKEAGFKSYVFDIAVKATNHPLNVYANGSVTAGDAGGYCVIGNFGNTVDANEQMKPYEDKYTKEMDKYFYKNGMSYRDEVAEADSIVYKLDVNRPDNGWGDLYLMFAPKTVIDTWKNDKADSHWSQTIRPQVNYDAVDATAIEGGVIYSNNHSDSKEPKDMSINPLLSDAQKYRYSSYTVYLNVTTSTYRIEFHDAYYLAGPAATKDYADRIELAVETNEGSRKHWKYTGRFTRGQKFLVFSNHDSMGFYFREDGKVIEGVQESGQDIGDTPVNNVDDVVAPTDKDQDFNFYNRMKYVQGIGTATADEANAINFNLPTGEYTIRFYDLAEDENGTPFYTIDKVVTLKNASSTSSDAHDGNTGGEENFGGGWATYSDDVATYIPYGVKAYYVDKAKNGKVHLKELEKIIPAHCGVLLHNPTLSETSKSYNLIPVVEGELFTTSLQNREGDAATNLLKDCYQVGEVTDGIATTTSVKVGPGNNVDGYNYFFTNKITASVTRKTGTDASGKDIFETKTETLITPMNFWRSNGNASRKKTYLHVDKEISPALYSNGSFSFNDSEFTDESAAKSYCFVMTFADIDDFEESSVVTAVESVRSVSDTDTYYNIQGMKVDKPTHGLYIKNGKKIYIK